MYKKKKLSLIKQCQDHNLPYHTVFQRIKTGWSIKDALNTPVRPRRRDKDGNPIQIKVECKKRGLNYDSVRNKLYQSDLSVEEVFEYAKTPHKKKYYLNRKRINLAEECRRRGLGLHMVLNRIKYGETVPEALSRKSRVRLKDSKKINPLHVK